MEPKKTEKVKGIKTRTTKTAVRFASLQSRITQVGVNLRVDS